MTAVLLQYPEFFTCESYRPYIVLLFNTDPNFRQDLRRFLVSPFLPEFHYPGYPSFLISDVYAKTHGPFYQWSDLFRHYLRFLLVCGTQKVPQFSGSLFSDIPGFLEISAVQVFLCLFDRFQDFINIQPQAPCFLRQFFRLSKDFGGFYPFDLFPGLYKKFADLLRVCLFNICLGFPDEIIYRTHIQSFFLTVSLQFFDFFQYTRSRILVQCQSPLESSIQSCLCVLFRLPMVILFKEICRPVIECLRPCRITAHFKCLIHQFLGTFQKGSDLMDHMIFLYSPDVVDDLRNELHTFFVEFIVKQLLRSFQL